MSDRWNYQPDRAAHVDQSYKEWSYNGYQQPLPNYYNQNHFGGPVPYGGRGVPLVGYCDRTNVGPMQQRPGRVQTFPLNPNAAAFVPRSYRAMNQGGAAMSYYTGEDADVRTYEAMYNQFPNGQVLEEYIPSQQLHHDMVQSDNLVALQEIQVGLEQILSDTDDFDSWAGAIRDRMVEKRMSAPTRAVAVNMVLEMAVSVAPRPMSGNNPQHTLARLLNFLCLEIPSLLRDAVLKLLSDFHTRRLSFHPEHRINLSIFFAEVYENMEMDTHPKDHTLKLRRCYLSLPLTVENVWLVWPLTVDNVCLVEFTRNGPSVDLYTANGAVSMRICKEEASSWKPVLQNNGSRIDKVGEALLEQLDDLLKLDMNDNLMKTVVQLVKLCGRHLDASPELEPRFNQLLTKLLAFAKGHPQLSESVKTQIMNVAELRKNAWGLGTRGVSGTEAVPSSSSLSVSNADNGYIIGEDGSVLELNEEERSFLESQFNVMEGFEDAEHDESFDDQEVLKDFGDFVEEEEVGLPILNPTSW